jgi:hypothetical protein
MLACGYTITLDDLRTMIDSMARSGYTVGPSARGFLRCFFLDPVSLEFYSGENPTTFEDVLDPSKKFRLDPNIDAAQVFPESPTDSPPSEWNRNLTTEVLEGTGDDISGTSPSMVLTDSAAPFLASDVGCYIYISGASTEANNGLFLISGFTDTDEITYQNSSGVAETFAGTYTIFRDNQLALTTGVPFALRGVQAGDTLEYLPAINDYPSRGVMESSWLCVTQAGSNTVRLVIPDDPGNKTDFEPGHYLFIDSGPDTGAYIITKVLSQTSGQVPDIQLQLDKILTFSTEDFPIDTHLSFGNVNPTTAVSGTKKLRSAAVGSLTAEDWVSVFAATNKDILTEGDDVEYLGTFSIDGIGDDGLPYVTIDRSANFPADAIVQWVAHTAPSTTPASTSGGGKELSTQYVRCRVYSDIPEERAISIPWEVTPNPISTDATRQVDIDGLLATENHSHKSPYRVLREGVYRVSSTFMSGNRLGALYYADVPVVGYGPLEDMNILGTSSLKFLDNWYVEGFLLVVENEDFTYSIDEQVKIVLPESVLPVGSSPDANNKVGLSGQSLQVSYDYAPLVSSIQSFLDSPMDRVLVANTLARHFLPSYVIVEADYSGGDSETTLAPDVISYVNSIDPDINQLRADDIVGILKRGGATRVILPVTLVSLTHGNDRRIRGERSTSAIGYAASQPLFKGTAQQNYFIAGPDASKTTPRPSGEQVYLRRR